MVPENDAAPAISSVDAFTPIHKGIRAMIYSLSSRLQSTDFADPVATAAVLDDLRHEFAQGVPAACVLCLLHSHGRHEDDGAFPAMGPFAARLVAELIRDHREFEERLSVVQVHGNALRALTDPAARVRAGKALTLEMNEFFARYFAHMNREEAELVPLMNRHLTDEQILALIGAIEGAIVPDRFHAYLRWMYPALNVEELTEIFAGMRAEAPPAVLREFVATAEAVVPAERWRTVRARAGL
jgi:hypothetical protein